MEYAGSLATEIYRRALAIDPDDPVTVRLREPCIALMVGFMGDDRARAEAFVDDQTARARLRKQWEPARDRLVAAERAAKTPADLLAAAQELLSAGAVFALEFRASAIIEVLFHQACKTDPDDVSTLTLEEMLVTLGGRWWAFAAQPDPDHPDAETEPHERVPEKIMRMRTAAIRAHQKKNASRRRRKKKAGPSSPKPQRKGDDA